MPRDYKKWFCGTLIATAGNVAFSVALQWAATAHGGGAAGTVLACGVLPQMILLLVGGAVADRVGPRRVMITTLAAMVTAALSLAAIAAVAGTPVPLLVCYSAIAGTINGFHLPAATSMVRRLVDEDMLPRALATQKAGQQIAAFVGAPLGGTVAAAGGLSSAALINALAFTVVTVALLAVRPDFTPAPPGPPTSLLQDVRSGIQLAARDPLLRPSLLVMAATAAFFAPVAPLLIPLIVRMHAWQATAVGWILGAESVAFFVVAALISRRGTLDRLGLTSATGIVIMGAGVAGIAVAPNLPLAIAAASAGGLGYGIAATHLTPLVINAAPPSHLSRTTATMALAQNLSVITMFVGSGGLAETVGPDKIALFDGLLLTAIGALALTSRPIRRT
ncbi:MFS transporter [Actinomadura graeca]|uniref:MFS transporter n=1 Tax=Actinomadura graeca TaxID=2750812 RepID=A0ABX8QUN0_9ACTN|nr:MFS transporter [Actinomadura graeca]QXJ22453.1 MFS transporter [Actinomadura graeca]